MRLVPCLFLMVLLSLGTTGCSLFQKKPKEGGDASKSGGGREPARFPTGGSDPIRGNPTSGGANYNNATILAGYILDEYTQPPKEAYVSWVALDESKKDSAPIDVQADPHGNFTIHGVKPNQHYKLMARAKESGRVLAGVTYAKAPDIHVVIRLRTDLANKDTPPVPGAPAYTPKQPEEPKKTTGRPMEPPPMAQTPPWNPGNTNPAANSRSATVPDLPAVSVPGPAPSTKQTINPPGWVPGIAQGKSTTGGVPVFIPYPSPPPSPSAPPVTMTNPVPLPGAPASAARVPSCVLLGRRLSNFALYDLNHQPWEYKNQHRGKVMLLDFWGSWCVPCKHTLPDLIKLQSRYGSELEIIGIAYEEPGPFEQQARKATSACQANGINYRVLLGATPDCPVRREFGVRFIPTLVLLDENGWILWRHEGQPSRADVDELEFRIKRQLGIRP